MADRVHPQDSPIRAEPQNPPPQATTEDLEAQKQPVQPTSEKPVPAPPAATYVIQVPKDQIFRVPPPENARKYQEYTRKGSRRSCCFRCFCWTLGLIVLFITLLAIAGAILYLVFRPEALKYSVQSITIKGMNLTAESNSMSPEFDIAVRADNPNNKIGVYYENGSNVTIKYSDVQLCSGVIPTFYQPSNNITIFTTTLTGSGVALSSATRTSLVDAQSQGSVPLNLKIKAPVKIKLGSIKTWKITVKVSCDISVNNLSSDSTIVSKDCGIDDVDLW
ncbi:Late embryogenesis abundant protein, LEA_2 subgroup [Dillenia turbinata]|uniref:Late embryogenesis abundant protein, LEA_2 subgroup n=1 Tax=Dillenia turbinata TaxID=194707 RepID=A0AAN8VLA8_9MAGN